MNYYDQIIGLLISNEVYKKVKDYSKNKSDVETYYNVGKLIIEAQGGEKRAKYGDGLIKEYSERLIIELNGKKYNAVAIYHPSYLMQYASQEQKDITIEDLKLIKSYI